MAGLRLKAHHSLKEFRESMALPQQPNGSFSSSADPGSPTNDEDDELAKLGGRTRLISPKDPSKSPSIPLDRSPTSLNPVVPLQLPNFDGQVVHPNMLNYLQSFARGTTPMTAPSDHTMFNVPSQAVYGSRSIGNDSYMPHHDLSPTTDYPRILAGRLPDHQSDTSPISPVSSLNMEAMGPAPAQMFPQYFPVFDYGTAGGDNSYTPMQGQTNSIGLETAFNQGYGPAYGNGHVMQDAHTGYVSGEGRLTPEGCIQNSWVDFVAHLTNGG